jgi:hypothetical protein
MPRYRAVAALRKVPCWTPAPSVCSSGTGGHEVRIDRIDPSLLVVGDRDALARVLVKR